MEHFFFFLNLVNYLIHKPPFTTKHWKYISHCIIKIKAYISPSSITKWIIFSIFSPLYLHTPSLCPGQSAFPKYTPIIKCSINESISTNLLTSCYTFSSWTFFCEHSFMKLLYNVSSLSSPLDNFPSLINVKLSLGTS